MQRNRELTSDEKGKGFPRSLVTVGGGGQGPTVSLAEHMKGRARSFSSLPYSSLDSKRHPSTAAISKDISSRLMIGHGFEPAVLL